MTNEERIKLNIKSVDSFFLFNDGSILPGELVYSKREGFLFTLDEEGDISFVSQSMTNILHNFNEVSLGSDNQYDYSRKISLSSLKISDYVSANHSGYDSVFDVDHDDNWMIEKDDGEEGNKIHIINKPYYNENGITEPYYYFIDSRNFNFHGSTLFANKIIIKDATFNPNIILNDLNNKLPLDYYSCIRMLIAGVFNKFLEDYYIKRVNF